MGYYGIVLLLVVAVATACVLCSDPPSHKLEKIIINDKSFSLINKRKNRPSRSPVASVPERCNSGERFLLAECIICKCGPDGLVANAQPCEQKRCIDYIDPPYRTLKADIAAASILPGTFKYPTSKHPQPEEPKIAELKRQRPNENRDPSSYKLGKTKKPSKDKSGYNKRRNSLKSKRQRPNENRVDRRRSVSPPRLVNRPQLGRNNKSQWMATQS